MFSLSRVVATLTRLHNWFENILLCIAANNSLLLFLGNLRCEPQELVGGNYPNFIQSPHFPDILKKLPVNLPKAGKMICEKMSQAVTLSLRDTNVLLLSM